MINPEVFLAYVARYRHKASVLTLIHSALAHKNNKWDVGHTCSIVILTGLITFVGFIGTDRLIEAFGAERASAQAAVQSSTPSVTPAPATPLPATTVQSPTNLHKATLDFVFNFFVVALFLASLLNLIFRWKERQVAHFQGVVKLKQFAGWLDELVLLSTYTVDVGRLKQIRQRYDGIVELLPPNSDDDYKRAKEKIAAGPTTSLSPTAAITSCLQMSEHALVLGLVRCSPAIMEVLLAVSKVSGELWLGGGSVRTAVWDYLTNRRTQGHDFDIVYFDALDISKESEKALEAQLQQLLPRTFSVSVKNQARMHLVNGEPKRSSLEDAISNWPERATAMAVRLSTNRQIELFLPYGSDDLLDLVIRPTPYHQANTAAFERRLISKDWKKHWPEVEIQKS